MAVDGGGMLADLMNASPNLKPRLNVEGAQYNPCPQVKGFQCAIILI